MTMSKSMSSSPPLFPLLLLLLMTSLVSLVTSSCVTSCQLHRVAEFSDVTTEAGLLTVTSLASSPRLQCARLCAADQRCVSLMVHPTDQLCRLYTTTFDQQMTFTPAAGYQTYQTDRGRWLTLRSFVIGM